MSFTASEHALVSPDDRSPKYRQIIAGVRRAVASGALPLGSPLPSINTLCRDYGISRDTAVKAYAALEKDGVISALHGKGFFTAADKKSLGAVRALMLLDSATLFKEEMFNGALGALPKNAGLSLFFHNRSADTAAALLRRFGGACDFAGIIPPGEKFGPELISVIKELESRGARFFGLDTQAADLPLPGAYQDFAGSFAAALSPAVSDIRRFKHFSLVIAEPQNHIIKDLRRGFRDFCGSVGVESRVNPKKAPERAALYLVIDDRHLAAMVKEGLKTGLQPGKDYGLISYNDTPLKEIICGGLSVISTDFSGIGRRFADFVKDGAAGSVSIVPASLVRRCSF
jgi:DNA-binding transcriptional regulator YhcF (GntR family)